MIATVVPADPTGRYPYAYRALDGRLHYRRSLGGILRLMERDVPAALDHLMPVRVGR